MTSVLITGMSGTGKSTVIDILAKRGHTAIKTDEPGWCVPEDGDWTRHDREWIWDEDRISSLLDNHVDGHIFLSGCRPNQGKLYGRFGHIVVFSAPIEMMLKRVATRTNNPFGSNAEEQAAIAADKAEIEPLLIQSADMHIDTSTTTPKEIADRLEALL